MYMLTTTVFQNCEFMSNELFPSDEFSSVYWVKKHTKSIVLTSAKTASDNMSFSMASKLCTPFVKPRSHYGR